MKHFTNQKQNREAAIDFMLPEKDFWQNTLFLFFETAKQVNRMDVSPNICLFHMNVFCKPPKWNFLRNYKIAKQWNISRNNKNKHFQYIYSTKVSKISWIYSTALCLLYGPLLLCSPLPPSCPQSPLRPSDPLQPSVSSMRHVFPHCFAEWWYCFAISRNMLCWYGPFNKTVKQAILPLLFRK